METQVNTRINVDFEKLNEYKIDDMRFTKVKIWLMHLNENYNGSIFTEEATTNAIPSLANTPILGYIEENSEGDDDFSDHRMELERNNGEIKVKYKGSAYGVIPETNYAKFENKICGDGKERTFLTCQGLLWNKFEDSIDIFNRDTVKDESMELAENYTGSFNQDGYFVFDKFLFNGACALGSGVQPAMEGACIDTNFTLNEIKVKLEQFQKFINSQSSSEVDINSFEKGGQLKLTDEIKNKVLAEFSLKIEDLNFDITDDMTEESLRDVVTKFVKSKEESASKHEVLFSATYQQKYDAIQNALEGDIVKDADGNIIEETRYWVEDFDDTYAYVAKTVWTAEDYNRSYGRLTYSFDETNVVATISGEFEEMIVGVWLTVEENQKLQEERNNLELLNAEYAEYKSNYSTPNSEVKRLQEFEKNTIDTKYKTDVTEIFTRFEKQLNGVAEFETLKEKHDDMEVNIIEEKCFAMLGKKNANFSVKAKDTVVKLPINYKDEVPEDPYGGILAKKYNKQ